MSHQELGVSPLRTSVKVTDLTQQLFATTFTDRGIRKILRRLGLTFQRPDRRASRADPGPSRSAPIPPTRSCASGSGDEGERVMFADQVEGVFGPPGGPRLGPEGQDAELKQHLADEVITDRHRMRAQVRSFLHSVQRLAAHVRGHFQAPHTSYTTRAI